MRLEIPGVVGNDKVEVRSSEGVWEDIKSTQRLSYGKSFTV